jgi:hypothetical protein
MRDEEQHVDPLQEGGLKEALRLLRRRLYDVVHRTLLADDPVAASHAS